MITTGQVKRRMLLFRKTCGKRGLRITPQRTEVFREVARTDEHPDAETVMRRVRQRLPNISLDTVYRILYRLEDEGLISRLHVSGTRLRFDGDAASHHHMVCTRCGAVGDFVSEEVGRIPLPPETAAWGEITGRHLLLRGRCRDCAAKRTG